MKMFKNQYGWSTKAWSKDKTNNKCYISINFPKGCEPNGTEYEFELFIEGKDGVKYPTYISSFTTKDGSQHPTIAVKEPIGNHVSVSNKVEINEDDLPF